MYPMIAPDALLGLVELVSCLFTVIVATASYLFMMR